MLVIRHADSCAYGSVLPYLTCRENDHDRLRLENGAYVCVVDGNIVIEDGPVKRDAA